MEIRVKRTSTPSTSSIICHADRKKHKYVAKVKIENGRYRYFYTKEAYQQYLNENKSTNKNTNTSESIGDKVSRWLDTLNTKRAKLQAKAKKKVEKILDKYSDRSSKDSLIDKRLINKAKKFVDNLFDGNEDSDKTNAKKKRA